jgi:hypothetical protein
VSAHETCEKGAENLLVGSRQSGVCLRERVLSRTGAADNKKSGGWWQALTSAARRNTAPCWRVLIAPMPSPTACSRSRTVHHCSWVNSSGLPWRFSPPQTLDNNRRDIGESQSRRPLSSRCPCPHRDASPRVNDANAALSRELRVGAHIPLGGPQQRRGNPLRAVAAPSESEGPPPAVWQHRFYNSNCSLVLPPVLGGTARYLPRLARRHLRHTLVRGG